MKLNINMSMGSNEVAVAEINLKDAGEWDRVVAPVLKKLEDRCGDRARRIMAANGQMKTLFASDPKTYNLVHNLVLMCMGQVPEPAALGLTDIPNAIPDAMQLREAA